MTSKYIFACLGICLAAACTLGSARSIVYSAAIPSVPALATNTDSDLLLVADARGRMQQVDSATGAIESTYFLWTGTAANAVAMTSDGLDSSRVWAVHADGWVVNWSEGPTLESGYFKVPVYENNVTRVHCDIDQASDGDFYATTLDNGVSKLWRQDGGTHLWGLDMVLGGDGCARIAHDLYSDELYILLSDGFTLEHRDEDSLALLSSVQLDVDSGDVTDVDAWGNAVVGAGTSADTTGPGGVYVPAVRSAYSYDPSSGDILSSTVLGGGPPSSVHITVNGGTGTGEMLIGSSSGNPTVRGVLLLN